MSRCGLQVVLLLCAALCNEATTTRLLSKKEVMSSMTTGTAVAQVLSMQPNSTLVSVMRQHFKMGKSLRTHSDPVGYGGLAKARDMLNEMVTETNKKLDVETIQCDDFEHEQQGIMEELRGEVGTANAAAASARHIVLDAQAKIIDLETRIPETKNALEDHEKQCETDVANMKAELAIVSDDIQVVGTILNMTDCNQETALMLVQCQRCDKTVVHVRHRHMSAALGKLRSRLARESVQQGLAALYSESAAAQTPAVLSLAEAEEGFMDTNSTVPRFAPNALNTTDVPQEVQTPGCVKTTKCSLATNPNCENLQDRFMKVEGGMIDMKEEMEGKLADRVYNCKKTTKGFKSEISMMETTHNSELSRLAEGTKTQVESERQSHVSNAQHKEVEANFHVRMKSCCSNKNQFLSEICALEKIRGELLKMKGETVFLQDCEVSDWVQQPCQVTCGGGKMVSTRTVTLEPQGGAACPALRLEEDCGMEPCPVDCILEDWSGWSACSAECGGGVMERQRQVRREPQHNGEPCAETIESVSCNVESCDSDCELADWTSWGSCSKACGGGVMTRHKTVAKTARGDGFCPELFSKERYAEKSCNKFGCEIVASNQILECKSRIDLVILLDGSASLGSAGWAASKAAVKQVLGSLKGGEVNVALLLFSGPIGWGSFKKCAWGKGVPDLEMDCSMKWVSKFTNKTEDVLPLVDQMDWPRKTTLTSMALSLAREELSYSRKDTRSAVLVITDGKPMRKRATRLAARRLQKVAQVTWVLVGSGAPSKKYVERKGWASKPYKNNIVSVSNFDKLKSPMKVNDIISDLCPIVG